MNILFYGAGVIGSIYAAHFALKGHKVTVLARGRRLAQLQGGMVLKDAISGDSFRVPVNLITELSASDHYDLIVVAVRNEQIDVILPALSANCSTAVLLMVNTAKGHEKWAASIGADRLLAAFPAAGGYMDADGVVHYFIMRGMYRFLQKTTIGEVTGATRRHAKSWVSIFSDAGFPSEYCDNMDAWQKTHVAIISPICSALYKHQGNNISLSKSKDDVTTMVKAIREGFAVLRILGYPVTPVALEYLMNLPMTLVVTYWRFMLRSGFAGVAIAPHANNAKEEMQSLAREFNVLVHKSGLKTRSIDSLLNGSGAA